MHKNYTVNIVIFTYRNEMCRYNEKKIAKPEERYIILVLVKDPDIFFITSHFIGSKITMSPLLKY